MNIILAATDGSDYVAAAYLVFVALLLIYLGIMAGKLVRIQGTLTQLTKSRDDDQK